MGKAGIVHRNFTLAHSLDFASFPVSLTSSLFPSLLSPISLSIALSAEERDTNLNEGQSFSTQSFQLFPAHLLLWCFFPLRPVLYLFCLCSELVGEWTTVTPLRFIVWAAHIEGHHLTPDGQSSWMKCNCKKTSCVPWIVRCSTPAAGKHICKVDPLAVCTVRRSRIDLHEFTAFISRSA